ncbi:MAG: helix-turn-helix transcriptional regulator [Bacteroidetes bacterium]|nr:helix-turn-helix transcriptional regulator [Bacteroidota bacterium]MCW5894367.1 helix-turn-helix transcriptional regulator [Bacteroidota bacterium]
MKELAKIFKALSDESRLRILNLIFRSGEICVCDIESITGFTQTKTSRHLSYLRNAELVDSRQEGLWMLYSITKPKNKEHEQLLECLKAILQTNSVALKDAKALNKNISNGCCTTFNVIKPEIKPAVFELN